MPEQFHFLQPAWFLTLLPLALLLWLVRNPGNIDNPWRKVVDARLLPWLLVPSDGHNGRWPVVLLAAGWLLAVLALADPVWNQQPQPVFRNQAARVIVLDLSRSMLTPDLKPSRLIRARYKVADLLQQSREGQTALVVFAGDAFAVSPLTSDTDTIQSLLAPLEPALMPAQGSRVDLGLRKAGELLQQAGARQGDILLITDGFDSGRTLNVAGKLHAQGYRVSVLGTGTAEGAPLPDGSGSYVRDRNGNIVVPELDISALQKLAAAGGGRYVTIRSNNSDIEQLVPATNSMRTQAEPTELNADIWQSRGPWLVLLLLPLAALVFRRGWLLVAVVLLGNGLITPQPVMASTWDDLWLRRDQQAERALQKGELEQAQQLAEQPQRRGTAAYRAGKYEQAVEDFAAAPGPDAAYNRGNALAKLGRYQEAIEAYDRALATHPGLTDATHNRAEVEKLLQQQQDQQNQDNDGQQSQEQQDENNTQENQDQQAQSEDGQDERQDESGQPDQSQQSTAGDSDPQEQETGNERDDTNDQAAGEPGDQDSQAANAEAEARPLDTEEQLAAEQWLRRIPDDPGGLLRRKFLYQYRQRAAPADTTQQTW